MSISVSYVSANHTILETDNVKVLYRKDEPVAIQIGDCVMSANECSPGFCTTEPYIHVIVPQTEINHIVGTL